MRRRISAACLVSALAAGAISTLANPVTADKTTISISVNRDTKGDRQPFARPSTQPSQQESITIETLERTLLGCEPALSSLVEPKRAHILTYCAT